MTDKDPREMSDNARIMFDIEIKYTTGNSFNTEYSKCIYLYF